jgi:acyltransferase
MSKIRHSWIDIAKGIGIILVVYGHALSAQSLRFIIYSFHMPLFFFLSGLVFTYRPEERVWHFIKKNAKNILIPYVVFAFLSFLLWFVTRDVSMQEAQKQFLSIFYGNGNNGLLAFNNILWFLPCLFITRVGFYILTRFSIKTNFLLSFLCILSLVAYGFSLFFPQWKLFFGIETALTAIVFFGLGYYWTTIPEHVVKNVNKYSWALLVVFTVLCVAFAVLNFDLHGLQVDMRQNRLNNYAYFYLAAFGGIGAIMCVSFLLKKNRALEYLGRRTLVLFAWHLIAFSYSSKFLTVSHLNSFLKVLPVFLSPIIYSGAAIIVILVIDTIVHFSRKRVLERSH